MNEERLSRGKRLDNGQWAQGYIVEQNTPEYHAYIITDFCAEVDDRHVDILECDIHEVGPDTVGRCTGLTDGKGRLIFEGDIAGSTVDPGCPLCKVCWDYHSWELCDPDDRLETLADIEPRTLVVMGNIHDNPQLMEPDEGGENHGETR